MEGKRMPSTRRAVRQGAAAMRLMLARGTATRPRPGCD